MKFISVNFVLDLLAFILTLLASLGISSPRVNLGWLGVALFILGFLFR